jgi:ABC-type cobalamin/Fe3+-siderophores transport system ATPase subunit
MKIKNLYVDGYKNLIRTQILFDTEEVPIVIIGNNGTGKSNLVEALVQIFISLYYGSRVSFSYNIEYQCHGKYVRIDNGQNASPIIKVDGFPVGNTRFKKWIAQPGRMAPFPDLIFCYYSGTCERTKNFLRKYNRTYTTAIKKSTVNLDRLFVFSDLTQAKWSLMGLFAHRHRDLLGRLSVDDFRLFLITVTAPETYSEEKDDPSFWGTEGAIRDFLADLDNAAVESNQTSSTNSASKKRTRVYLLQREGIEKIGVALEKRGTNFQSMMHALAGRKMISDIKFLVTNSRSGAAYEIDDLSEGEKQLLTVVGGLKVYSQAESLVLLDEPDTHLNPNWSWEYESLLKSSLSEEQRKRSTILIATHDPILISGMTKEQVLMASITQNRLTYQSPLRDPRGQGVANVLTSEFFGLPSSLDKNTQSLLDERLRLAYKPEALTDIERNRLKQINEQLDVLGMSISFRDPDYAEFERTKYNNTNDNA